MSHLIRTHFHKLIAEETAKYFYKIEERLDLGQLESPGGSYDGYVCHEEDAVKEERYSDIVQAFVATETNSDQFMRALRALKEGLLHDAEREAREALRSVAIDSAVALG